MSDVASMQISVSSGGGPSRIARLENGVPTWQEVSEEELAAYTAPPTGEYHLKITGIGETFNRPKRAEWIKRDPKTGEVVGKTETTFTRLEFEIQSGKGKGRKFSSLIPYSLNEKSHLGQVWMALIGPIGTNHEVMDLLDKELQIYVVKNEDVDDHGNKKVYANPTWSTARAAGAAGSSEDDGWEAA